ncbi:sorbosone dehydrogenase family protein [Massilia sp. Leaf139]|uniref:PQQ-dependent sugar dehydrogenase n=1 Tax=Massilia sp. Leaf139 TaxID=1736272 RepID=UPI000701255B|nr:PQQ-dependent sugar dehydrogenase [Massilia sp. Leaf139]KQQ86540.1 glucose dehydrogenase [Massilia sp. Leaf139]
MLVDRVRMFLGSLLALLFLLAGCGGGVGNPGTIGTPDTPPPAATTGSLQVVINGLPAGVNGAVRVTGPNNYSQDLTGTQTLANLTPGSYTVAASSATQGSASYTPTPLTQSVAVTAGATATATLAYASTALTLALADIGPTFTNPTFVTAPPGDTRLFVVERRGVIRIVQGGVTLTQPWLDISPNVFTGGEGGLLSMAFDPDFARNGYFYLYYTDLAQNIVVERYGSSSNANLADPTSGLVILRVPHPQFTNHFGGLVAFGPDSMLYAGTGDGGGSGDPQGNAQNLNSLLGKLLRVDVRGATGAQPYTIPPNNPYLNQAGRRPEIWAYGLRNPWRFAFDGTQLYVADVGQDAREEVNVAAASQGGLNYGWDIMEGTACFGAASCDRSGLTLPSFEYEHGANDVNGCSITGGYVYRGTALPELAGRYFYSDFCRGFVKSFFPTEPAIAEQRDWNLNTAGQVVSFGRDGAGELYVVNAGGRIFRITRGAGG